MELSASEQKEYDEWIESRPPKVKEVILKFPPTQLYRFKDTKKECAIISYHEPDGDGEVTVTLQKTGNGGAMAAMGMGHLDTNCVFDVSPDDLETFKIEAYDKSSNN